MSLVGTYVALSKPLVAAMPVFLLAWLRFGIAGIAMGHWLIKPAGEPAMTSTTKRLVFLESFLGNFLFSICMLYGVSMTSAVSAGVILAAIPAVVAIMGWLFLGERIERRVWVAIACAVVGIGLMALSKSEHYTYINKELDTDLAQKKALIGNLLVFGAVLCEGAYVVIGKRLTGALSPKRISSMINLWGFVLMTPAGIYLAIDFDFASVPVNIWGLLMFYALAASMWTVWLWMTGMQTVPAAKAGVFTVMLPVFAAITGIGLLGERLGSLQLVAFGIALTGVVLATLPGRSTASLPHIDR
ncbi:MAG: hypothetical protein RL211_490 [Pseudomonadota bacterium]|jgi:drug/metabolite transporter (DMT)-like permease